MRVNPTDEEYLQTYLELLEDGIRPIGARLAERLGISAAAVSEGMHRLIQRGYAVEQDRIFSLTATGEDAGRTVIRRHRLAECFLVNILGLRWERAHLEAARWEHALSEDVEQRIIAMLDDPAVCPHGNPIPGSKRARPPEESEPLAESRPGRMRLVRISELAQSDEATIAFLAETGLLPGAVLEVLDGVVPPTPGISVRGDKGDCTVPPSMAALLWVKPA
ncbi:MAG TPA: metal-dependent transcriptional regulator [Acidimicrobiia bacterium]|nr:metal-dependent transcriptional regulator [Acidimicrobiia bacterium]